MFFCTTSVLFIQQRILRIFIFETGLTQDDTLPFRNQGLQGLKLVHIRSVPDFLLTWICMHIIYTDDIIQVICSHFHPIFHRKTGFRMDVMHHCIRGCQRDLLLKSRILLHLGIKAKSHRLPQFIISVRSGPVSVRFIENHKISDAVEAKNIDQVIQIIHRHLNPLLRIFHCRLRRIELSVNDSYSIVLAVLKYPA